jgi:hypothetical protein
MAHITRNQYQHAFEIGQRVADGMSIKNGIEILSSQTGMNERSAADYISFVLSLLQGGISERSVQYDAADYFMERVSALPDAQAQERACRALAGYVVYYKRANQVERPRIEAVLQKWRARL